MPTTELMDACLRAPWGRKQVYQIAVLERSPQAALLAPEIAMMIRCGRDGTGQYTPLGQRRTGRYRCRLTICDRCQARVSVKASIRAVALVDACSDGMPDHERVTFATINAAPGSDKVEFQEFLRQTFRRLGVKYVGQFQIGLTGLLHVHAILIHEQSRRDLGGQLREVFPGHKQVFITPIDQSWISDGVDRCMRYACEPIHGKNPVGVRFDPDTVGSWALAALGIGALKLEGGFTRNEKEEAVLGIKSMSAYVTAKKKAKSILLVALKRGLDGRESSKREWYSSTGSNLVEDIVHGETVATVDAPIQEPWRRFRKKVMYRHAVTTAAAGRSPLWMRMAKLYQRPIRVETINAFDPIDVREGSYEQGRSGCRSGSTAEPVSEVRSDQARQADRRSPVKLPAIPGATRSVPAL